MSKSTQKFTKTKTGKDSTDNRNGYSNDEGGVFIPVKTSENEMPSWYNEFFETVKSEVAVSRRKAMMTANVQMIMMYYHIGKEILARQESEGWGAKIIDRLSFDLKTTYPEQSGFSPRNLKYMRKFAQCWPDESIVQRSVA